jgi:hypothetical protein
MELLDLSATDDLLIAGRSCTSAQKAKVTRQAVLDLRHVIPGEIVHEFTGNARDVDGADLIGQDFGLPPRDDDVRPEDGRVAAQSVVTFSDLDW